MDKKVKQIIWAVIGVIIVIVCISFSKRSFEEVGPGEIVILQDPWDGEFHVLIKPGTYWQNFGSATHYRRSTQFWFSKAKDQGTQADQSIKVRFNDGGHATISGSVRFDLPLDDKSVIAIHTTFGSQEAIEAQLIRTVIEKSVYMTGPLLSSKESYAEKRNDLISYIADQASLGVYRTRQREVKGIDPMTNAERNYTKVEIVLDTTDNIPAREEHSPIEKYHITMSNLSINSIDYDKNVEMQITAQQNATMQVQTAIAKAKEAEQQALTVEKQGEAKAAEAKWAQEVIKAKAVTEAQQQLEVAQLDAKTALQEKAAAISRGEGEGAYKKLVTQANNNVELRLKTWEIVMGKFADAMSSSNWVPTYVMGGGYGGSQGSAQYSSGAMDLINLMMANTAKQAGLDMAPLPNKK